MPVVAIAEMYGISGARQELLARLADAERAAAGKPGCRRYTFAATLADPDQFVLVSEWEDQASMDAHYASEDFAQFQFGLRGLLAKPSDMVVHVVSETTRLLPSGPMDPRDAD